MENHNSDVYPLVSPSGSIEYFYIHDHCEYTSLTKVTHKNNEIDLVKVSLTGGFKKGLQG